MKRNIYTPKLLARAFSDSFLDSSSQVSGSPLIGISITNRMNDMSKQDNHVIDNNMFNNNKKQTAHFWNLNIVTKMQNS